MARGLCCYRFFFPLGLQPTRGPGDSGRAQLLLLNLPSGPVCGGGDFPLGGRAAILSLWVNQLPDDLSFEGLPP